MTLPADKAKLITDALKKKIATMTISYRKVCLFTAMILPTSNNAARLQNSVGKLSISLNYVKNETNGSQALPYIRTLSGQYLPGFTATVEWGQLDAAGMPLTAEAQSQQLRSRSALLPKTEQVFELRLSGVTPEQLGYIHSRTQRRTGHHLPNPRLKQNVTQSLSETGIGSSG